MIYTIEDYCVIVPTLFPLECATKKCFWLYQLSLKHLCARSGRCLFSVIHEGNSGWSVVSTSMSSHARRLTFANEVIIVTNRVPNRMTLAIVISMGC